MRIASFRTDGIATWGVVIDDAILDARDLGLATSWPTVCDLIRGGEPALRRLASSLAATRAVRHPLREVHLLSVIPHPPQNLVAVGLNYRDHTAESASATGITEALANPMFFTKASTSVVGTDEPIRIDRSVTQEVDWEVELAVIIGMPGRDIPAARAQAHVFGYTIANDISARDLQFRDKKMPQFYQSKSLDTFCPLGPWIVTADELPNVGDLRLQLRVNGVTKQDDSTASLIFSVGAIIAELSRARTLGPGEVILTGTPAGVGFTRVPPEFLQHGDVVEAEIEGIGVLRNPVVEVDDTSQ